MRCECKHLRRMAGYTHLGAGCPDCRTCWACCTCGWEPSPATALVAVHPADLVAELLGEVHASAAGHHATVKSRMDSWKAGA